MILFLAESNAVIELPDVHAFRGTGNFPWQIHEGETYHVGVVNGWIMARIGMRFDLRQLMGSNMNRGIDIKISIKDIKIIEPLQDKEFVGCFGKKFWECPNIVVFNAKSPGPPVIEGSKKPKKSVVYPSN